MAVLQYVGARYVPALYQSSDGSIEWESDTSYESLTMVTYNNTAYISRMPVTNEVGAPPAYPVYWARIGTYDAYIESIQKTLLSLLPTFDSFASIDTAYRVVEITGFYVRGDKGAGVYEISDDDKGYSLPINGKFATPIACCSPYSYGAYGDGVRDDTKAVQLTVNAAQYLHTVWSGDFAVSNIDITAPSYIDFLGSKIIGIGSSGYLLNIEIPYMPGTDDPTFLDYGIRNINLYTTSRGYSYCLRIATKSLHVDSVQIRSNSNGMICENYDGISVTHLRIESLAKFYNTPLPAIGLNVNREDINFGYVDINDFQVCIQVNVNRSFNINSAHLWSSGGTGIQYMNGVGGHIGDYIADSLDIAIEVVAGYGTALFIGHLQCEETTQCFQVPYSQSLSFITVGMLDLADATLVNSASNNGSLHISSPIPVTYGFQDSLSNAPDTYYSGIVRGNQVCFRVTFTSLTSTQVESGFGYFEKVGPAQGLFICGSALLEADSGFAVSPIYYGPGGVTILYPFILDNITRVRLDITLPFGTLNV